MQQDVAGCIVFKRWINKSCKSYTFAGGGFNWNGFFHIIRTENLGVHSGAKGTQQGWGKLDIRKML